MAQDIDLARLKTRITYREGHEEIFPSIASLDWFVRKHHVKLKQAKAIYEIGGRILIDPPAFNLVALEIGSAAVREVSA